MTISEQTIHTALQTLIDPNTGRDFVTGKFVKNINLDGNNVSLDRETRLLAENALRFSVATSLARSQLHAIQSAIQDGKSA